MESQKSPQQNTIDPMGPGAGEVTSPMPGRYVVGQYVLERPLGEGGMAEVWLARNLHLGTPAAIKFLNRAFAGHPEIEQRFLNEGRRQGSLNHPNIVKVYGFEYVNGRSFLILQYIEGEALDQCLRRVGRLAPEDTVRIAGGVLNALEYAHNNNIVHRDIKPANILLDAHGYPYLGDFGIVLAVNEKRVTQAGTVMGTSWYMSPEQITSPGKVDARSDIYSFGCVLYEMLSGRPPFDIPSTGQGDTDFAIKMAHVQQTPMPLRQLTAALSPKLEQTVMRCLAKDPDYRYRNCGELRDALTAAVAPGAGVTPPGGGSYAQFPLIQPKKKNWLWIVAALLLAAIGLGVWYAGLLGGVAVDTVSVCQGGFNSESATCQNDPAAAALTVFAPFHGAKPGKTIMRSEWRLGGKLVETSDPLVLAKASGVYYQRFGTAAQPGDYKVTLFADGAAVGDATAHITPASPPTGVAVESVSICQGVYDGDQAVCHPDPASTTLTAYVKFHGAAPLKTTLRNVWEFNGSVVQQPDPHILRNESATYYQPYGNAAAAGEYKVTTYADGVAAGSAAIALGPELFHPNAPKAPSSLAVDSVSICQGAFDSKSGNCTVDMASSQLTVVARFHGATPQQTKVTNNWQFNGTMMQNPGRPYALRYDHGWYYDPYTASTPGEYSATVFFDGAAMGTASIRIAAPSSGFHSERAFLCRGNFNGSTGVCQNNAASNVLTAVLFFDGATPRVTRIRTEWEVNGMTIRKSDGVAVKAASGWYYQEFGNATAWGQYKATIYVDGAPLRVLTARIGF